MLPRSSRHTSCRFMKGGTNVVADSYGIDDTNVVANVSDNTSDDPDYVNST